jgi:flagellar export protein FliJ
MRRFKFRFEAVEKVRRNREQQVLRLLGGAQRDLDAAKTRKIRLEQKLEEALKARELLGRTPVSAHEFALAEQFIRGTHQRIGQAEQGILRAQRALEKATRVYLLARRQLKAIETLREKHLVEWKRARAKKEQSVLEDLITTRTAFLKEAEQ